MESLFWHLANRTEETKFIFNLFHLLLAGLTFLVLLHQLREKRRLGASAADRLLPLGFFFIVLHFSLLTLYFAVGFYFHRELGWPGFGSLPHGLMACGVLLVVAACLEGQNSATRHLPRWVKHGCGLVVAVVLVDALVSSYPPAFADQIHTATKSVASVVGLLGIGAAVWVVWRERSPGGRILTVALASLGVALFLQGVLLFLPNRDDVLVWNAEQHILSASLFAFAWVGGERSRNLLDRVFVRLNLTFILLASLIMLITAGMEKYQYLRLAEERSMDLAEFLRGHITYYRRQGENLERIFHHPEVLRRVVVEFGTMPELREVNVYLDGKRASFRYSKDWEVREEIAELPELGSSNTEARLPNGFRIINLPLESGAVSANRIEFIGTMDYINAYIGKYIMLIYLSFTIMVALATAIIGIIVIDTDRRLGRQYAELQEAHQQLAQAAKLASVGQLAGGVAHEINTPITSILSLASHLAEGKGGTTLTSSQRRSFQIIAQQAERVSKTVGNLLTFSRQSRLEVTRIDMEELLENAITLVQYRVKDGSIRFLRDIKPDLPPVLGDTGRLTEVFVNLLNNSVDSMPGGGKVTVLAYATQVPDNAVCVEVTDTGCGIPPEILDRVFDPFFTTKEPGKGTGLGLSISHGIVKGHGGEIWARSRPGEGTTTVVTLPRGGEWT